MPDGIEPSSLPCLSIISQNPIVRCGSETLGFTDGVTGSEKVADTLIEQRDVVLDVDSCVGRKELQAPSFVRSLLPQNEHEDAEVGALGRCSRHILDFGDPGVAVYVEFLAVEDVTFFHGVSIWLNP